MLIMNVYNCEEYRGKIKWNEKLLSFHSGHEAFHFIFIEEMLGKLEPPVDRHLSLSSQYEDKVDILDETKPVLKEQSDSVRD